jgi:outer membrane protein TolC
MRSKKIFLYALGFTVAAVSSPVNAQTVFSLDSCRNMAIGNNKSIRIADETVKSTGYERKAAKAAYLPGIDFEGMYMYNQHKISLLSEDAMLPTMSFNPATGSYDYNILKDANGVPVTNPSTGSYIPTEVAVIPKDALSFDTRSIFAGAVTLTQPIYMGGQIKALNDIAKYAESAAVATRNQAVQNLVYEVDEAYWQVVSLRAKRELAQSFVNLVDTLHYNVEAMLAEGVATKSDLLTVDVKLNEAKIMLTKVDNGLSLSRMALAQVCGLPINSEMRLADEQNVENCAVSSTEYTYNMDDVYAHRQDLNAVRQGISLLQSRERLTLGNMLPKVGLIGMYTFSTPNVIDGFSRSINGGFHVGATVTIPIWHWGGDYNHYRAAKTATNAQRLLLEDLEEKVSLQVSQAQFKYQEAFKTYNMSLANMKSAEENLRNAQLGYSEGMLTTNDVITAQTGWLQANSEKIDACIGVRLCEVYLSKVLGTIQY